ncbi:MAG TPA: patatin-like phospholipase family protein [Accumulibacter sp.]|uniref:patatin-like phospholipase family protein n=1 Tax=Accumulibacter sp. TaxID=2053492 RepID=UPI0026215D06|nr:patatin-like phospholipase family protein [Accumulibacter sp.]MDS4054848.1 patatin-like phospholipase family protein [Accumulibacter sp.]HMW63233.1 patatin-like phospholipase family protein [Accumulibacter sp.]HMW79962.1 patatin-like phospholipase family protein [Accumulibacter sp.]HMX68622.1 patatin-like phospholipase family protein [Accumulibacter sp.]HNB67898.1 patatin-like phospholipase family protein [Accumulibacter sp.]
MPNERTALVLGGGGARAAYQVGVLQAIRDLLGPRHPNPFPIVCGASAGAVNAATLACYSANFSVAVDALADVWRNMHADQIYRADALGIGSTALKWLAALLLGWALKRSPRSLLDNQPLRRLLEERLDFTRIARSIDRGTLYAASITASGYVSGHSVSFFQAHPEVQTWRRAQRAGCRTELTVDHLLASSAIPFIFPAVHLNREYFGDGSMRQLAPVSPAIHLGARKVLIIGVAQTVDSLPRQSSRRYPTPAQIIGHVLSSIFLDGLAIDAERIERVNRTLALIPHERNSESALGLRPLRSLIISPSERLDYLAARNAHALPWPVRTLLHSLGAMNRRGGALTSYLLFEKAYTETLIALGYKDAMDRVDDLKAFFDA